MSGVSLLERPDSKGKFIAVCKAVRKVNQEDAENIFEVEKFNFLRQIGESDCLKKTSEISKVGTFLEVISNGLTFDKSSKQVYLIPRGNKLGYSFTADGLIYLATAANSIRYCTAPTIVYEGDTINVSTTSGKTVIEHQKAIPRASNKILGGFVHITFARGEKEAFWMGIEEMTRLSSYSGKQNRGKANALYTSGEDGQPDTGFFGTKIVKAALKNVRKKKVLSDHIIDEDVLIEYEEGNDVKAMIEAPDEQPETVVEEVKSTEDKSQMAF